KEIWQELNYTEILNDHHLNDVFVNIHELEWNRELHLGDHFIFKKLDQPIQEVELKAGYFDLVYFDAFNPDLEPQLWTEELFTKIYTAMNNYSLLTTYSTKGVVKRAMKSSGFTLEKKPGPPGKREILNAVKSII
ncbi:MAG: SAM-dependent methyltransferase, partial [Bacteroidales bacterium]|nr:SAM-dependent methyltransferase [Bacteroidales bacterium]